MSNSDKRCENCRIPISGPQQSNLCSTCNALTGAAADFDQHPTRKLRCLPPEPSSEGVPQAALMGVSGIGRTYSRRCERPTRPLKKVR